MKMTKFENPSLDVGRPLRRITVKVNNPKIKADVNHKLKVKLVKGLNENEFRQASYG